MEPQINDTQNEEHLSIKVNYYTSTFEPPNKGNPSIKDKTPCPKVSLIRFHCINTFSSKVLPLSLNYMPHLKQWQDCSIIMI